MSDLTFTPYGGADGAGRLSMTDEQLERAALRLSMKTRLSAGDVRNGQSDPGTDAALVAQAYLDLKRNQRPQVDMTKLKMHPSIQLASGAYFDFTDPQPVSILDLVAGLSRICRYTGQLAIDEDDIYTVAQHSVLASENCEPGYEFEALMHDRFEGVGNDMASPFKQLLLDYKHYENLCEEASAKQFGLPHPMSDAVKRIDLRMLCTEKRDLMPKDNDGEFWSLLEGVEPLPFRIIPWRPAEAKHRFLQRYYFLTEGRLPQPGDPYAKPHPNAPKAWVDALTEAWGYDCRFPAPYDLDR